VCRYNFDDIVKSRYAYEKVDTIIIGGGLSGIYAAFLLAAKKKPFVLLQDSAVHLLKKNHLDTPRILPFLPEDGSFITKKPQCMDLDEPPVAGQKIT